MKIQKQQITQHVVYLSTEELHEIAVLLDLGAGHGSLKTTTTLFHRGHNIDDLLETASDFIKYAHQA